ncbi:MAG: uracil permease [Firmicutes bacterium]|nr:uracil permease [Bacillota bacterium]MBO2520205.1 uracil permease [Bacillota bacterium]
MSNRAVYDVHEVPPLAQMIPLSVQHLFAMFGATVLVPILTGMNPSLALLTSGLGTLLFQLFTRGKVPAYLGSSFAYIAPIIAVQSTLGSERWLGAAQGAIIVVGLVYAAVALIIAKAGTDWLDRVMPPVVIGSVIVVIGMGLAPVGIQMAGLCTGAECGKEFVSIAQTDVQIALVTLAATIVAAVILRGFFAVIPVLIGIVAGYLYAALVGAVDFEPLRAAAWIGLPWATGGYALPTFDWVAISLVVPAAMVTIAEHLGDVFVLSKVVGREFYKEPGLTRTLLGDGLATSLAGLLGGPPNTTYGENVGVLAITRVYSTAVIGLAAVFAILLAFVPKLGAFLQTIPTPVMGGISLVLFGIIASSGIRTLVESGIDFGDKRNLIIASVVLGIGIGGAELGFGRVTFSGMALAALVGVVLNLLLPDVNGAAKRREEAAL